MKLNSRRVREIALVVLVALAATLANLPEETLERFDIDRGLLLGSLALVVFIALFLYLKFQFFFLVVLLAVAANMPGEVAESLGISTMPLVIAMATMVGFSLINYVVDLLPTGLEKKPKHQSVEGIKVLFYAIEKGNLIYAQKVLSQNFDPNLVAENGYTPLMYAAARGDSKNGGPPAQAGPGGQLGGQGRRHADRARVADRLAGGRRHPEEGAHRTGGARQGL